MIPAEFDYARPGDLSEALRLLRERVGEAKVLSGGYSLIPLLKLRLAMPSLLVDIRDVAGLDGISITDGELRVGGRVTHARLAGDADLARRLPIIHDAATGIGDPQVRNWGTIGGSCAHADPSSDWPAVLIACRASVVCRNTERERVVAARDFFVDTFQTAIEPDEILTEVRVPLPGAGGGSAYQKLERRAGDFATVGAAVALRLGSDGRVAEAGLGLTAVAEAPFAATAAEAQLTGATPDAATLERVAATAAGQARPVADRHGPVDYKTAMVREMTLRALRLALQRAGAAA